MQGRLSPPVNGRIQAFPSGTWKEEFSAAAVIGLDCIEWIYEAETAEQNPLTTDTGLREMRLVQEESNVGVGSVCADYFMSRRLLTADGAADEAAASHLEWLIGQAAQAGARHIVLPFVDASRLTGRPQIDGLVRLLRAVAPAAQAKAVELHLETDLAPADLASALSRMPDSAVRANLDTGNSASLGHDPRQEMALIGSRVASVHVKDRVRGGGTVALGEGDADLPAYFELLAASGYDRPFILQVARGRNGEEVDWIRRTRDYVVGLLNRLKNQQGMRA
jgi:L-ribulose-5-phosphate 3-epimerase